MWLTFIIRWVDDIWFAVVCFMLKYLSAYGMDRCTLSATERCEQTIEMIKNAIKITGFDLKHNDADKFVGVVVFCCQTINCFMLTHKFQSAPGLDKKYQNYWSFNIESINLCMMIGLMVGRLDGCTHLKFIFFSICWNWFAASWVVDTNSMFSGRPLEQ